MIGKDEIITPELIKQTANKRLSLVKPMLEALRTGDIEELSRYEDIKPLDLEKYFQEVRGDIESRQKKLKAKKKQASFSNTEKKIIDYLQEVGVDPVKSDEIAKSVIKANEGLEESELLRQALKLALSLDESAQISSKEREEDKNKIKKNNTNKSLNRELKAIVDSGKKESKSAYLALNEAGFIKDPFQEFY